MSRMATVLLLLIVPHLLGAAAATAQRVALPACRDRCGNITIPYPFGVGAGCFRDDGRGGFQLECNDSRSTPRLTVTGYGMRITGLSVATSEARAHLRATRRCYDSRGRLVSQSGATFVPLVGSHYLFSQAKNRLVTLGCPSLGYLNDVAGYYVSGCMAMCQPQKFNASGSCTGVACCQSTIPPAVDYYEPFLLDFTKEHRDRDIAFYSNKTTCRYVFLVETKWLSTRYTGDSEYLNWTKDFAVPVILDWAIRNVGNCSAARRNATDFACKSAGSRCFDATNGPGYRCSCPKGYDGNPYLDGGCAGTHPCPVLLFCFLLLLPLHLMNCFAKWKTSTSVNAKKSNHARASAQILWEATLANVLRGLVEML